MTSIKKSSSFVNDLISFDSRIELYNYNNERFAYLPSKDKILIPAGGLPRLSHEIAHMVEIKKERCILPDWGFGAFGKLSKKNIFAKLSREIRVLAIERHIRQTAKDGIHLLKHNISWNNNIQQSLPFGRFKNMQDVETWASLLDSKTFSHWSLDRIKYEWSIRLKYIQNWMES